MGLDLMGICMTLSRKDHKTRGIEDIIPGDLDLMAISMILSGNKNFSKYFEGFQPVLMSDVNKLRL